MGCGMPPKQIISKSMILEAAFEIVREKGMSALSARNIAKELNCSTQPIYSCFKTMKELEQFVIRRVLEFVTKNYLSRQDSSKEHFLNMGLGYIKMARKETHLFDLLYLSHHVKNEFEQNLFPIKQEVLIETMKKDERLKGLSNEALSAILHHMWIYTHGLAMLARSNPLMTSQFIYNTLHEMGSTLILSKCKEQGVIINENHRH
jgi:AcrR family transcriptional regulator